MTAADTSVNREENTSLTNDECVHTRFINKPIMHQKKKAKCEYSTECGKVAQWMCLAENCETHLCGAKSGRKHCDAHYKENPSHCLQRSQKGLLWCYACNIEVFPSEATSEDIKEHMGKHEEMNDEVSSPVAKSTRRSPRQKTEKMEAEEANTSLLPKPPNPVITNETAINGTQISHRGYMAYLEDDRNESLTGLTGLFNLGNTCYMNAALQALSNCAPLREYIRTYPVSQPPAVNPASTPFAAPPKPITQAFSDLLDRIWTVNRSAIAPRMLLTKVRDNGVQFRGFSQQDSQEFIRCFLDWLHHELRRPIRAWEEEILKPCTSRPESPQPMSTSSSSSSSRNDIDMAGVDNDNFETADSGLSSDTDDSREKDNRDNLTDRSNAKKIVRYQSIINDIFDGELVSSVKCLTCLQLSNTQETFQDISLSIPTVEQLELMRDAVLEMDSVTHENAPKRDDASYALSWISYPFTVGRWIVQPFVSLFSYFYRYIFTGSISLENCLKAFFSADHLHGEDMYSCEKCSKLRNGVKQCKVTRLPEILCIHLKRFRHDSMYNTKIGTRVTFPLCDLDMAPFVSEEITKDRRLQTEYDLAAVVCHHGSSVDYGHYVAYCRNDIDGNWYEYDDSHVTRVSELEVLSREAYVLFYRKKTSERMENARQCVKELLRRQNIGGQNNLESDRYFISHDWLAKFFLLAEPGPITNTDFLCLHGNLSPTCQSSSDEKSAFVTIPAAAWHFLHEHFGGGPACERLTECVTCRHSLMAAKYRKDREKAFYLTANTSNRFAEYLPDSVVPKYWFDKWKEFITQPEADPPGPIDNETLIHKTKEGYRLRSSAKYVLMSYEAWLYLQKIYGGGPQVFRLFNTQPTAEEIVEKIRQAEEAQQLARERFLTANGIDTAPADDCLLAIRGKDSEV